MARHEIRHRASVVKRFEPIPPVRGNVTRFEQLFLNLLINAAHAVAELDRRATRSRSRIKRAVATKT